MVKKQTKKSLPIHKKIHRHVKLAIVPHKANQFQPHIIRSYGIVAVLLVASVLFAWSYKSDSMVLGTEANVTATELLNDTNAQRLKDSIVALNYNDELSSAAYLKAQDMFKQQYWSHVAPDGTTPWTWFGKVGYNYAFAGENLAKNFTSANSTIDAWMGSQKHRENILNPHYRDVGFAVVDGTLQGRKTKIIVALYGEQATTNAVAGATSVHTSASVGSIDVMTRFGISLQEMSPALLGAVVILLSTAVVAMMAHAYRRRLPLSMRRSWRYHHGLYKATGLSVVAIIFVATLYSGGQI
ncbi:MAG: CAP domain-containing protein [Candidatus Saccharimonadales bacterium]